MVNFLIFLSNQMPFHNFYIDLLVEKCISEKLAIFNKRSCILCTGILLLTRSTYWQSEYTALDMQVVYCLFARSRISYHIFFLSKTPREILKVKIIIFIMEVYTEYSLFS